MENQDLVTVTRVRNSAEAEVIRGVLESIGIPCMIGGESQGGFAGVLEIEVMTSVTDADRAREYLESLRRESEQGTEEDAGEENSEAIMELPPNRTDEPGA
jgi:putative signal transducing protein